MDSEYDTVSWHHLRIPDAATRAFSPFARLRDRLQTIPENFKLVFAAFVTKVEQ